MTTRIDRNLFTQECQPDTSVLGASKQLQLNAYTSTKLRVISFVAILLVVYLHAKRLSVGFADVVVPMYPHGINPNSLVQTLLSEVLGRIAIPIFFGMSGLLFFRNIQFSARAFLVKYRKRVYTLLVPYLVWSTWAVVLLFLLQSLPGSALYFPTAQYIIRQYSPAQLLDAITIHPIPFQLWFLQDLMIMVALSPIVYLFLAKLGVATMGVCFLLWFFDVNIYIIRPGDTLFFALGAFLAIRRIDINRRLRGQKVWMPLWLVLACIETVALLRGVPGVYPYLHKFNVLLGILAVWCGYDAWIGDIPENHPLLKLVPFTFFIFAAHEPALTMTLKLLFRVFGFSVAASLGIYLIAPVIVISLAIATAYFLKSHMNWMYRLATGGR